MKNLTQKTVSLLLVAVFILALALSAVAAVPDEGEVAPTAACNHIYDPVKRSSGHTFLYYDTSIHCYYYTCTQTCRLCKATRRWTEPNLNVTQDHANYITNATCNGTTQTWTYYCSVCNHATITKYLACKGAPHGTVCHWLPI